MSELHQTWSSFQCSVAVTDIFLAPKSNQTRKNMLLKEIDTIDGILTVVLELKHVCNSNKTGSSLRHVWILFRYQGLPRHGETSNVAKTFRGKEGFYAGSRCHLPLCRLTLFFPCINAFFPLFIQQWGHWARTGVILRKKKQGHFSTYSRMCQKIHFPFTIRPYDWLVSKVPQKKTLLSQGVFTPFQKYTNKAILVVL